MIVRNALCVSVFAFIGALAGCGSEDPPAGCPSENEIRGACAGVPQAAVCSGDTCSGDVVCSGVTSVASDAELQAAAAGAASGACIALEPGSYGSVELPGGVSLLGKSAADVTVGKVTLNAGEGAVLRGFKTSTISVNGATGAKIEAVHVLGGDETGVLVAAQSSVSLVTSTIEGTGIYGLFAVDPLAVSLDRVVIAGAGGPGLWIASSSDCPAEPAKPVVSVKSSIVRGSHVAGVGLYGVKATLQAVDILGTVPGAEFKYGKHGAGLTIASCSDVASAKGLRVHDSASYGVLVQASKAVLGGQGPDEEVEIHRNVVGLSIRSVPESVTLEGAQLDSNEGVGIDIRGESQGVIICKTGITGTVTKSLPTGLGARDVGDGLVWAQKSSATISDLALSGNSRASMIIDGEAAGALFNVTLSGGDESLGIVLQNFSSGAQPTTMSGTPALTVSSEEVLPIADPPAPIPRNL
jgi:hypothetical protein